MPYSTPPVSPKEVQRVRLAENSNLLISKSRVPRFGTVGRCVMENVDMICDGFRFRSVPVAQHIRGC